jgi:hypothetical protein
VEFPGRAEYPAFLVQRGELGLEIGGAGLAAGAYTALIRGLTSSPSLLGEPMEITVGRTGGAQGPTGLALSAVLDHTGPVLRDSVALALAGVGLPELDLQALGGRLSLGSGQSTFSLRRVGEEIDARLDWVSTDLGWIRASGAAPQGAAQFGTAEWARELVWNTLTGIGRVELGMSIQGSLDDPSLSVSSNLGEAIAESLQRELGAQIAEAETRLRQEVDARIQPLVTDARGRVDSVRTEVADRVSAQRQEVDDLRARLEARIQELTERVPVQLPGD